MKKYLILAVIALTVALIAAVEQARVERKKWEVAMGNVKAYSSALSDEQDKSIALQLTVDQLEYYQDSILKKLDATRKELKIKKKNIKTVQYIESTFTRTDTIVLKDTLFKEPSFAMDTLIGDEWYSMRLGLKYPSIIAVKPDFKSEKHIIVSSKKETVNPPKKFFLLRWLQRKHRVVHVDVVEKNPYVNNQKSEYVEIIK